MCDKICKRTQNDTRFGWLSPKKVTTSDYLQLRRHDMPVIFRQRAISSQKQQNESNEKK